MIKQQPNNSASPPVNNKFKRREIIFYAILILAVVALFGWISKLSQSGFANAPLSADTSRSPFSVFTGFVSEHASSTFGLLLIQIIVILIVARLFAWVFTKLGQPAVIGEIIAGIALGPSILGLIAPDFFQKLFPIESIDNIALLSQFGLILFMFVIGMELELSEIKKQFRKTVIISHAGIIIPFIFGAIAAIAIYPSFATDSTPLLPFILFVGIAMSITAFPVLARILQEKGQMKSHLGIVTLASAANGDITAWCLLAMILAISQAGSAASVLFTLLFAAIYMVFMFYAVKPLFRTVGNVYTNTEVVGKGLVSLLFLTLLISSYLTEILGLHALFGAFIAGVVMPEDQKFRRVITEKVEDVALSIFLPLFFVASGLRTEIGLLNNGYLWLITLVLILVAVLGKLGGTYVAARVVGENRKDSLYMGVLMNTRGLMELVVLTMGMELGILPPVVFAMLVIMTLVTTFMTTPTISLMERVEDKLKRAKKSVQVFGKTILFSFGRTETGMAMVYILQSLMGEKLSSIQVMALHMTVGSDVNPIQAAAFEEKNFQELNAYRVAHDLPIQPLYEVTDAPANTILKTAKEQSADLLMVGVGFSLSNLPDHVEARAMKRRYRTRFKFLTSFPTMFGTHLFKDKTDIFIGGNEGNTGIVIDHGLRAPTEKVLILSDDGVVSGNRSEMYKTLLKHYVSDSLTSGIVPFTDFENRLEVLSQYELLVISYDLWLAKFVGSKELIDSLPTTLIFYPKKV